MSSGLTPDEARKASDELLKEHANQYRPGTGAHTNVTNEINRRHNAPKARFEKLKLAVTVIGIFATFLGAVVAWLKLRG